MAYFIEPEMPDRECWAHSLGDVVSLKCPLQKLLARSNSVLDGLGDVVLARGKKSNDDEQPMRVRVPDSDEGEQFGIIVQMLGHDRVRVRCEDGQMRVGRIPGRMKKRIWMRVGDTVLIVPWAFQSDEKCDVIWRYRGNEVDWLERKGILEMF